MNIRRVLMGEPVKAASARPVKQAEEKKTGTARPSTDRLELSRQWVENMEEQRARAQAALLAGGKREKESSGILDLLGGQDAETAELDAKTQQLKTQMKCLEISMRMMKGKKVPPEDEQYLMENDPEGYRITMAMRKPPKKDEEECESVLDEKDRKKPGEASGEPAPAEGPSGGEEGGAASHGGE